MVAKFISKTETMVDARKKHSTSKGSQIDGK